MVFSDDRFWVCEFGWFSSVYSIDGINMVVVMCCFLMILSILVGLNFVSIIILLFLIIVGVKNVVLVCDSGVYIKNCGLVGYFYLVSWIEVMVVIDCVVFIMFLGLLVVLLV